MLKWHHQLKNVLLIQDRLMSTEDQSAGIHEEIHFWEERLTDLHSIRKQLQRTELRNIIRVLIISKSAYLEQFLHAENEIQVNEYLFVSYNIMIINQTRNSRNMLKIA
jgi:hypothetical protein